MQFSRNLKSRLRLEYFDNSSPAYTHVIKTILGTNTMWFLCTQMILTASLVAWKVLYFLEEKIVVHIRVLVLSINRWLWSIC